MRLILLIVLLPVSLYHSPCHAQSAVAGSGRDSVTVAVFANDPETYGYDIFIGSRKIIHQPSVPSIAGLEGFASEEDAAKVGWLVAGKIARGITPPTVTRKELEQLGVQLPPRKEN